MDIIKHASLFDPVPHDGQVAIIGLGALGSALALLLAKLDINNLHLYDSDVVEGHNLPNQMLYGTSDVGRKKAYAAAIRLENLTGNMHSWHNSVDLEALRHRRDRLRYKTVFVCVDSMNARERLFNGHVYSNGVTTTFCEGRMGLSSGSAYLINPCDVLQADAYREDLYPDNEVLQERGVCGNVLSIGGTATALASCMQWMFIDKFRGLTSFDAISFGTSPWKQHAVRTFPRSP